MRCVYFVAIRDIASSVLDGKVTVRADIPSVLYYLQATRNH
jgi:hypothetical protein